MGPGILSAEQVKKLIHPDQGKRRLHNSSDGPFDESKIDSSAIDLPLGEHYWEMKGSCRTGAGFNVADVTAKHSKDPKGKTVEGPIRLERGHVYLFKADCKLDLRGLRIEGKATAKSSVGRLDCLVRLLVNQSDRFDFVDKGREHQLYVEVTPISFDLLVKQGTTLSQLRLYKGNYDDISLTKERLDWEEDRAFPVVVIDNDQI